ncbi:uncharacterized protein LOC109830782 [Asparagus officinalis]|uniref:uncharacterized protein LOC109830782 n=1 Tax=Asparagus officinalis TaxID=4686 RepID=UPI00098E6D6A|nr:uncharacterized protein LOC109830782 [Asparagus officinalis]
MVMLSESTQIVMFYMLDEAYLTNQATSPSNKNDTGTPCATPSATLPSLSATVTGPTVGPVTVAEREGSVAEGVAQGLRITAVATAEQEGYVETSDGGGDQGSDGGDSVVGRTKSLTDEDLEELKGCLDLGFGFSYEEIPELCSTLPALELCYSISQRYMDEQQQRTAVDEEAAETSSGAPIANWKISSPGDHPEEVKARLKYWAQAVACTVRLCS